MGFRTFYEIIKYGMPECNRYSVADPQVVIDRAGGKRLVYRRYSERDEGHPLNEKFIKFLATGFGSGLASLAPGTAGTLVGIPLYWVFSFQPWPLWLITVLAFSFLAWHVSDQAEKLFGRKDAPCIVIDEIAGLQWTLFLIEPTVLHVALGFALFRLFDITKPCPARLFQDRLPGGLGVVADDLVAGVYGNIVLQILIHWWGV
ncbi:MAG: phosphatidylglycerophosphatase A [Deltaproteobacteria bacterium]|nr:phosphatidylglycerophosphatase A [Deltaproteobacteria bacterium]